MSTARVAISPVVSQVLTGRQLQRVTRRINGVESRCIRTRMIILSDYGFNGRIEPIVTIEQTSIDSKHPNRMERDYIRAFRLF